MKQRSLETRLRNHLWKECLVGYDPRALAAAVVLRLYWESDSLERWLKRSAGDVAPAFSLGW